MKTFLTGLMSVLMSWGGKILSSLGVSFVAYKGLERVQGMMISAVHGSLSGVPASALSVFYMVGGGVVLNWFFGCFAFVVVFKGISRLGAVK